MGDHKLFIFDIDSALDKLEDDLISTEIKNTTTISTPQSQQKTHKDEEISTRIDDESVSEVLENNGNDVKESSRNEPLSESILDSEYFPITCKGWASSKK